MATTAAPRSWCARGLDTAIRDIHAAYFEAGGRLVAEIDTPGGMPHVLAEFDLASECYAA